MITLLRRTSWSLRVALVVLAAGLLFAGSGLWRARSVQAQEQPRDPGAKPEAEQLKPNEIVLEPEQEKALEVKLVKAVLERGDHPLTLGAKISLDLEKTARIRPLYNVVIYKVEKHAGERVKKDDVILTVESTDLGTAKNNYLTQIANLEVAATTYRREALLRVRHATTEVDYENARSSFRQAAVALIAAREQCLLMGLRPSELEDLRRELNDEITSWVLPESRADGKDPRPSVADIAETSGNGRKASPWELDTALTENLPLADPGAPIGSDSLALRPPTDDERVRDARIALAEITKRFQSKLKNEEDGRRRARYTIRAPLDGVVISKDAARGEFVDPSQVIATVADTSDVWINLDIYQQQIASVDMGARVDVTTPAYRDLTFSGTITFIADFVDDTTHTLRARVQVDNPKNLLKSGMVAKCVVHCVDHEPELELPKEAIIDDGGRTFAIVKTAPFHYVRREVKLGLKTDTVVHVEDGVKDGEEVVLEGNLYIHTTIPLGD